MMKNTTPSSTGSTVALKSRLPSSIRQRTKRRLQISGRAIWVAAKAGTLQSPQQPIRRKAADSSISSTAPWVQKL